MVERKKSRMNNCPNGKVVESKVSKKLGVVMIVESAVTKTNV